MWSMGGEKIKLGEKKTLCIYRNGKRRRKQSGVQGIQQEKGGGSFFLKERKRGRLKSKRGKKTGGKAQVQFAGDSGQKRGSSPKEGKGEARS